MFDEVTIFGYAGASVIAAAHLYETAKVIKTKDTVCHSFDFMLIKVIALPLFLWYNLITPDRNYPVILFLSIFIINQYVIFYYKLKNIHSKNESKKSF